MNAVNSKVQHHQSLLQLADPIEWLFAGDSIVHSALPSLLSDTILRNECGVRKGRR